MLGVGGGEFVGAVHGGAGAEVEVAVAVGIQDGLKARLVRDADRTGREAIVTVGVVRRIILQMLEQNAVKGVAVAEGDGRVSLETHPLMETVQIDSGDR